MKLRQLLKDIPVVVRGSQELDIVAMTANSKMASPGCLFIAKRGKTGDGHRFILDAIAGGAIAILTDTYDPFLKVTQLIHSDVNQLEPLLGNRFYHHPSEKLSLFGVTGTSGKTTTTFLIHHLFKNCGLIGTVAWMTGKKILPSSHTTPDLLTLLHLLHEMEEEGCQSAAIEVSSHALDQGRVDGVKFAAAVYTNLSQDHLDYHASMDEYAAAKARLFKTLDSVAIVNGDDPWADFMVKESPAQVIRFGFSGKCDLLASDLQLTPSGMKFIVHWKGEGVAFQTQLIGRFNVYNILGAAGVALSQGIDLKTIAESIKVFSGVPGRLERINNQRNLQVFVDYAHKPEALKNVLETLQEFKQGKIITVFGCGGNRDALKRPLMASIAEKLSDVVIVTNDNPRQEDPQKIAQEIIQGFQLKNHCVELDRKRAIEKALSLATPDDMILIAGKGHENYQIFANETVPFDDREVVNSFSHFLK
jgi:UDP-N-acetylmuramoyl-L-alanyl-D-glutamate--2,6-diaminopimelate ligase